jgi:hypothetical protein
MSMAIDLTNNVGPVLSLAPKGRTGSETGSYADLRDFSGATVIVMSGTYSNGTHSISLEESADASTWTAVQSSDIIGTPPTIDGSEDANSVWRFGYNGSKRYIRVKTTVSGATIGAYYAAVIVRNGPKYMPVN